MYQPSKKIVNACRRVIVGVYSYNPDGTVKQENLNNSTSTTTYSYNDRGFLTSISNPAFGEAISYTGGYNNDSYYNGSIASDAFTYSGGLSNYNYTYSYDQNDRMTNAADSYSSSYSFTSIAYDNNGNITDRVQAGTVNESYTNYSGNRPGTYSVSGSGNSLYYDRDGNLTSNPYENVSATYDPFTLMTSTMTSGSNQLSFEYDASKERLLKNVNGTQTLYLRGINDYPLERETSSGTRSYIYGPTGLISFIDGGSTYFVLKDHLGSTREILGSDNSPVAWYDYTPFGAISRSTVNKDVAYKFTGQQYDPETGLYDFRARMYDPVLGIFYASDPAGQGFSPYMYVGGNPVNLIDPTGMWSWNKFWKDLGWGAAFAGSFFLGPVATAAVIGAYAGGAAYNNTFNPGNFNYNSAGTWLWMAGGAAASGLAANSIAFQQGLNLTFTVGNGVPIDLGTIGGSTLSGVTGGALAGGAVTGAMTLNDFGIPQVIAGGIELWGPANSDALTLGSMSNGSFGGNNVPPLVSLFASDLGNAYNGISSEALSFEQTVSDAYTYDEILSDVTGQTSDLFEGAGPFLDGADMFVSGVQFNAASSSGNSGGAIQAGGNGVVAGTSLTLSLTVSGPIGGALGIGYTIGQLPYFQNLGRRWAPYSQPIYDWLARR